VLGLLTGALTILGQVGSSLNSHQPNRLLLTVTAALFSFLLFLSIPAMLRRVLLTRKVSLNTLAGAIAAYLLLGLFFATMFAFIAQVGLLFNQTTPFFAQNPAPKTADFEYFSFITITTVGYGDLTPGNDAARAGAVSEAILGQVFLVTIVARVVSILGTERSGTMHRAIGADERAHGDVGVGDSADGAAPDDDVPPG
jgi:hypothetical protein